MEAGVADLIDKGDVRVKQGVEIARFTESSVRFTDGTDIEVDSVIFACVVLKLLILLRYSGSIALQNWLP